MAINLTDSWNGEKLSDVRKFIQEQLQKLINYTTCQQWISLLMILQVFQREVRLTRKGKDAMRKAGKTLKIWRFTKKNFYY